MIKMNSLSHQQMALLTISLRPLVKDRGKDRGLWNPARGPPPIKILEAMTRVDIHNTSTTHKPVRMDTGHRQPSQLPPCK